MIKTLTQRFSPILVGLALASPVVASTNFFPLPITAYNADMVVEKTNAPLFFQNYTSASVDNGFFNTGNTLFETGWMCGRTNESLGYVGGFSGYTNGTISLQSGGVPRHGVTFSSADGSGVVFTMAPDYTTNCAFLCVSNTVSGNPGVSNSPVTTITVNDATPYQKISLLNTSGNGGAVVGVLIHYLDGSSQQQNLTFSDWFGANSSVAVYLNGRVPTTSGNPANYNINQSTPYAYHTEITLTDTTSGISNIVLSTFNGSIKAVVLAVSASPDSVNWNPLNVSGWNADVIVEATAPHPNSVMNLVNVTLDNGLYTYGNTWFEKGFWIASAVDEGYGVPTHGSTFATYTNSHITFQMAPDYTTNCIFFNNTMVQNSSITIVNPTTSYKAIDILASGGGGSLSYSISHLDGNFDSGTVNIPNWFNGTSNIAFFAQSRIQPENLTFNNIGAGVGSQEAYYLPLPMTDTNSPVTGITFSYLSGGSSMIFAVSGSQDGTNFAPIQVSGWNADAICEASFFGALSNYFKPFNAIGVFSGVWPVTLVTNGATTATFDNGLINTANVFMEQGISRNWPTSGLPPAGSIIQSISLPDHYYQLAASYVHANNAIFLDRTNIPTVNIPLNSGAFTAMSFLGAAANGGTTNRVVLQHADGTSETNSFYIPDWFTTTINGAYQNFGRCTVNTGFFNNQKSDTANAVPRLYESQIALFNTTSPVTNVVMSYLASTTVGNSNSARTVIMAISGSTNPVGPFFNAGSVNPPTLWGYEGTNVTLAATLGGATTNSGIAYQWYKTPAGGVASPMSDGGEYAGTASLNLAVTGATWSNDNGASFFMVATTPYGSATSAVVNATLFSPLADICQSGDTIIAYQPNGGSSPAPEGVTHAIDGTVGADPGKYLNFGANGAAPFVGPIGFIVTPNNGSSFINVVRVFIANDTPGRDPNDIEIDGSNDGGNTFTTILADTQTTNTQGVTRYAGASAVANVLIQPTSANYQPCYEIRFPNTTAYTTYRVFFNHCWAGNDAGNNSIQIAEVQLLGTINPQPPAITLEPQAVVTAYVGQSPTILFTAGGHPVPITYQWKVSTTGPNGSFSVLTGATNNNLVLTNVQLVQNNNVYECVASNATGIATSTTTLLNVIPAPAAGSYGAAILADKPIAYLPLNEGPDNGSGNEGTPAIEYVGGNSGYYTNVVIAQQGHGALDTNTSALFGELGNIPAANNYVAGIGGINFGTASNFNTSFSIEAWVQGAAILGGPQLAAAVVVGKGYGNGGEQFLIDCGGNTGNSFRFGFRDGIIPAGVNAPVGHYATALTTNTADGNWHHLVGVLDEVNSNQLFYIDGVLAASNNLGGKGLGVVNNGTSDADPVHIGSGTAANGGQYVDAFVGNINEVAIYNYALSASNVLAHYGASGVPPYYSVSPTNASVSQGSSYTLTSKAVGTTPLAYQWMVMTPTSGSFSPIPNATNATFTIASVGAAVNGNTYESTVTNLYGTAETTNAVITVVSGPPVIQAGGDLPAAFAAYPGGSFSLTATVDGTLPFIYYWFQNGSLLTDGGHISGSGTVTLTVSDVLSGNAGNYQLVITNSFGSATSAVCSVSLLPSIINLSNSVAYSLNGFATLNNGVLGLTDGGGSEASSSFFKTPVYVGGFIANFIYTDASGAGAADGATFVIQNDGRGTAALGGGGGSLGVGNATPITPSVEFEYNIYAGNGVGGVGCAFDLNGSVQGVFPTGNVNITSGDAIYTTIKYLNGAVSVTLADSNQAVSFTTNFSGVNIPALVGGQTAYIGFTGGTGGVASVQTISGFSYTPIVSLTAQVVNGNYVFSWPIASGAYTLQSSSTVAGGWANNPATVTVSGGVNTATVPISAGNQFFRLNLE